MSTFDGVVREFPHIAIDYFRPRAASAPAVLAYFLSHVHSDHLQGLEDTSFGGAFIYCSEATSALLLKLQTKDARLKFADELLAQRSYKYGHLKPHDGKQLLRPLPMDTPITLLIGEEMLQVTLLEANHCPGACMFLIESRVKSVLYSGDVRAEMNFISFLKLNPVLLPYFAGLRAFDTLFLDTSARAHGPAYASKMSGTLACIKAMLQYPDTTQFIVPARCLGYEEFWIAAARALSTKIHVDDYTMKLFQSIRRCYTYGEAFAGDDGILTCDPSAARLHACTDQLLPCPLTFNAVYIKAVTSLTFRQPPGQPDSQIEAETDHDGLITLQNFARGNTPVLLGEPLPDESLELLPRTLVVEFARHSSWPELVHFVSLFRPKRVVSCVGEVSHLFDQMVQSQLSMPDQVDRLSSMQSYTDSASFSEAVSELMESRAKDLLKEATTICDAPRAQSSRLLIKPEPQSQELVVCTPPHRILKVQQPQESVAGDLVERYKRYALDGNWSESPRAKRQAWSNDVYL